ncbi:unnamed protein product [Acanthoscelides obtectus]|uniref:DDE Tnp4 domain-containing protein n=1 Tax=Acanthoscelides obtectus TaxID=200917 RepID=A0A9P0KSB1_ACAOB|nr:unnamed protein product [Acanthoscelides obtectus]CAK1660445.1 hypothetical protein AOBTE_LOCUS22070 [Acanthoscelides obtectus]
MSGAVVKPRAMVIRRAVVMPRAVVMRYLATGATLTSISLYFARGDSTVSRIIGEITAIIWDDYMPTPDKNQWKIIAQRFHLLWNLPNCLGALDGKHIRIESYQTQDRLTSTTSRIIQLFSWHAVTLMASLHTSKQDLLAGTVMVVYFVLQQSNISLKGTILIFLLLYDYPMMTTTTSFYFTLSEMKRFRYCIICYGHIHKEYLIIRKEYLTID